MTHGRQARTAKLVDTFTGHRLGVYDVVFSPDGERVASASFDGTAMIWFADPLGPDGLLRSDRVRQTLRGHADAVTAVAFHPDGRHLATGSADRTAKLWDGETGRQLNSIPHRDKVGDVALSPDGRLIATAAIDGSAMVWDCRTGGVVLEHHTELSAWAPGGDVDFVTGYPAVTAVAFNPDGRLLAVANSTGAVEILEVASGRKLVACAGHRTDLHRVAFSPRGDRLATASYDATARIWDAATGRELHVLGGYEKWVLAVAFDPSGTRLATGSRDHTADVWEVSSGKKLFALPRHAGGVWGADFSPDGRLLATASYDGAVQIWEVPRVVTY